MGLRGRIVVYPAAIAAAWVLSWYLQPLPPLYVLLRPLLVAIVLVVVLQLLFSLVTRNRHVGAFLAAAGPLLIVSWELGAALLLSAIVPLIASSVRRRRLATVDWPRQTQFLTVASAIVLVVTLAMGAARGVIPTGPTEPRGAVAAGTEPPDLFLVLLDGYPRADTLAQDFGFDNEPFLEAMEGQGFEVARDAHSNYNITWLTLASTFNTEHIGTLLPEPPRIIGDQLGALNRLINDGSTLAAARGAGYEIVSISGGSVSSSLTSADRFIDTGQVNTFEAPLLRLGVLPYLLPEGQADVLHAQLRERFNDSISRLSALADERVDHPRLVFAHLMAPHPPIVFDAQGGASTDDGCYPLGCGLFDQVYDASEPRYLREQLEYVNRRLVEVARHLIESNGRPAAIVFFSDHGFRHDFDDLPEMVRSLFISYTPDHPGLFPADASPINLLSTLLNAYAGTDIPAADDASFVADFRTFPEQKSYFPLISMQP